MEALTCVQGCLGSYWWIWPLAAVAWWFFAALVDGLPDSYTVKGVPVGRILHLFAGNVRRALKKTPIGGLVDDPGPAGEAKPPEAPKP